MSAPAQHPFRPAQPGDSRSPCPALNSLANHGYLPHDGKRITFLTAYRALRAGYNLSTPLALLLTLGALLLLRRTSFDLGDLAQHNLVEHDGSLSRADAASPTSAFAPTVPDPGRVESLLAGAGGGEGELTLADLARVRAERDRETIAAGRPLSGLHARIARGEVALAFALFARPRASVSDGSANSSSHSAPAAQLRAWFGEDRLPFELGWAPPAAPHGLLATQRLAKEVKRRVDEILGGGKKEKTE